MIIDKLDFMDELWYLPQCVPRVFPLIKNDRGENSILTDTSTGYSLMKIQIWKQPEKNVFKLILILQPDFLKSLKEYSGGFFFFHENSRIYQFLFSKSRGPSGPHPAI